MFRKLLDKLLGVDKQNKEIEQWGQSIPINDAQRHVMKILWTSFRNHTPLATDPLQLLTQKDLDYVIKICRADFRPLRFGDASRYRFALYTQLRSGGFSKEQTHIIVGMLFNSVGPIKN